jgi:hypothetical protein
LNLSVDILIGFLLIWGIPTIIVVKAFFKMSKDEQKSAITEFKSARFIFTIGFIFSGFFLSSLGRLVSLTALEIIGGTLSVIGGIVSAFQMWHQSKLII